MTLKSLALQTLYINGCVLLYTLATLFAGLIGWAGHLITEKICHSALGKRVLPYRDLIELMKTLSILGCGAANVLVSVGLLFLHLAGGLPHEYDMVVVQVGIALFGVLCFAIMCVTATAILAGPFWVGYRCFGTSGGHGDEMDDEESALLEDSVRCYGSKARNVEPVPRGRDDAGVNDHDDADDVAPPLPPQSVCIGLMRLSSARNIDVRRMVPGR